LEANKHKFEFNGFSTFFAQHVPGSCNAALHQVTGFGASLRSAFFDIRNRNGEGFFFLDNNPVKEEDFNSLTKERPADISVFSVRVVVDPAAYAPEGVTVKTNAVKHMTKCLHLPQTTVYTATGLTATEVFNTPRKKRTMEEFPSDNLGNNDWADVGLLAGTDLLEDYDFDVLVQLPRGKRHTLTQRSAALKQNPSPMRFSSPRA
jgi:hypothetical protein